MIEVSKYKLNRYVLVAALLLGTFATLFPPFEWNHTYEGQKSYRERGDYFTKHSTTIKTYEFLFAYNQKKFYSDVTRKNETFTRSIIFYELFVEYFLIGIVALLFLIIFFKSDKKNL